jgi:hypothetical protein
MSSNQNKPHLTASQRLEGLEQAVIALDQALANLATTTQNMVKTMRMLNTKMDSLIVANERKIDISNASIESLMVEENVRDLKARLEQMKAQGFLGESASEISETSFVVGRELHHESREVQNPRIQFGVQNVSADTRSKLLGKKVGDLVSFGENEHLLEIEEIYPITTPGLPSPASSGTQESQSSQPSGDENQESA